MRSDFFAVIQIPFVDLRRFSPASPNLVARPTWPSPSGNEFVRRLGGVRSRYFDNEDNDRLFLERVVPTERHYIDASRHLVRKLMQISDGSIGWASQAAFLRLIGDQQSVVRFEIGVRILSDQQIWHNVRNVEDAVTYLCSKKLFDFRDLSSGLTPGKSNCITLASLAADLRRRYYVASARHDGTGRPPQFNGQLLKPLDLSVYIALPTPKLYRWLRERSVLNYEETGFDVALLKTPSGREGNVPIAPSFAVVGNQSHRSRERTRKFRINYLRMRAELQTLWKVLSELQDGGLLEVHLSDRSEFAVLKSNLRKYLERALNRVLDTVTSEMTASTEMTAIPKQELVDILWAEDLVTADLIEVIKSRGRQFLGNALPARVAESLTFSGTTTNVFNFGVQTMSKYDFNAPVTNAAIGDASKFVQKISDGRATQTDLDVLAGELSQLIDHLKAVGGGDGKAKQAIQALEDAKRSAEGGQQSAVLSSLRAAGGWALEKAGAIGVPLAIAALTKALGL